MMHQHKTGFPQMALRFLSYYFMFAFFSLLLVVENGSGDIMVWKAKMVTTLDESTMAVITMTSTNTTKWLICARISDVVVGYQEGPRLGRFSLFPKLFLYALLCQWG